ncbi:MAG: sigma-70 family RNA polymerase sigma factor [Candidatus Saccharimonadales bacterium]
MITNRSSLAPEFQAVIDQHVWPRHRDTVVDLTLSRLAESGELDQQEMLASHLMLGDYVERRGSVVTPGVPVMPDELALRGIDLSTARRDSLIAKIDGEMKFAVQDHHLRPGYREHSGATYVGSVDYDATKPNQVYKQKAHNLAAYETTGFEVLKPVIARGLQAAAALTGASTDEVSADRTKALQEQIDAGREARNQIVEANLRLAIYFARRFAGQSSMEYDDILQIANDALITAVESHDPSRGALSTHLSYTFLNTYSRTREDSGSTIRVPSQVHQLIKTYNKTKNELVSSSNYASVGFEEVVQAMELKAGEIHRLRMGQQALSIAKLPDLSELSMLSTPEEFETDETTEIPLRHSHPSDLVVDDVEEQAMSRALRELVHDLLSQLTARENFVIKNRFGIGDAATTKHGEKVFDDNQGRTLENIGQEIFLTGERVRMIEAKALSQLRKWSLSAGLESFLDSTDKQYVTAGPKLGARTRQNKNGTHKRVGNSPYMGYGHDE